MLRVTIEIIPFGDESMKRTLDTLELVNDGTHPDRPEYGNYVVTGSDHGGLREWEVKDHCRADGLWELLRMALEEGA